MIDIRRTDSDDPDFKALVKLLDADLAERDGADHGFYSQFNKIDKIRHAVVCYEDGQPIGCGAIKAFDEQAMEVKRMYVSPEGRNKGIATRVLTELETWASEMGYAKCVLETGKRQPEAIALYEKNAYRRTENYGQYVGVENSVCFEKVLKN
ncbi:GNAT family N-acetyltransferase [Dyadobacter endophyticus]|uniref:GNAT family N-acetyltransferase n=1 Tax=Dyadobacter TaxID=120831 RepID=UPI003CF4AAB6